MSFKRGLDVKESIGIGVAGTYYQIELVRISPKQVNRMNYKLNMDLKGLDLILKKSDPIIEKILISIVRCKSIMEHIHPLFSQHLFNNPDVAFQFEYSLILRRKSYHTFNLFNKKIFHNGKIYKTPKLKEYMERKRIDLLLNRK